MRGRNAQGGHLLRRALVPLIVLGLSALPQGAWAKLAMEDLAPSERRVVLQSLEGQRLRLGLVGGEQVDVLLVRSFELGLDVVRFGDKESQVLAWDRLRSVERLGFGLSRQGEGALQGVQRLLFHDGTRLLGLVIGVSESALTVLLANGDEVHIARELLRSVSSYGPALGGAPRRVEVEALELPSVEVPSARQHRTRYFMMKSAKPLGESEMHFSQKELAFSEYSVGLTDTLSLNIAAAVPTWFAPGGLNIGAGLSAGFELAEDLYGAVALHAAFVPGALAFQDDYLGGANLAATLTWGPDTAHISLGVMAPILFDDERVEFHPTFILGGVLELTSWLAFMTEHWVSPTLIMEDSSWGGSVHMGGFRFYFGGLAFDVAAVHILGLPDEVPALPWLDVTYHWGAKPEVVGLGEVE